MASRRALQIASLGIAVTTAGCAGDRRFPLREPMWKDTDLASYSYPCEKRPTKKEPGHVSCAPEPYESPLAWDGIDNSIFRPLSKVFAVDPPREAPNVNSLDEVPDSAWFTNRIGKHKPTTEQLAQGACKDEDKLEGESAEPGAWVIDEGKNNGSTPGFRIKIGKRKFVLKADDPAEPERASAASAIGAAIYHDVGFYSSCEQIVYFKRSALKLTPGLTVTDNSGISKPFDQKALDDVLDKAGKRGDLVRMQASAWLGGYLIGPFKYEKVRDDDRNDIIDHEERRDLRGARVLAAWVNHIDAREQNSMNAWVADKHEPADSSPGYVRHYYLDTSDLFGSNWAWDEINRRLGKSYLLDWGDIGADFITLGIPRRSWELTAVTPGMEMFGYFDSRTFDAEGWKNEYPNPAFSRATERDNAWMARILSRFDREDIHALVMLGKLSKPEATEYLTRILEERLQKVLERYLLRLSPIADLRMRTPNMLCATDLARRRHVRPDSEFRYSAGWRNEGTVVAVPVDVGDKGEICMMLPSVAAGAAGESVRADARSRYVVVTITDSVATYPLRAHFYDLGRNAGYRLVGLERLEER